MLTALAEVQGIVFLPQGPVTVPSSPWALVPVRGIVSRVLDFTDPATLALLGTNEQEITGAWQTMDHPPTQVLAHVAYDSGRITGIRYPSAKHIGSGVNLVVCPDRFVAASADYLEVIDPLGKLAQRIGA